jgi:hypothetical protein
MYLEISSALLSNSFERPGPKSVSAATYCSGVKLVVWWTWIVAIWFSFCWVMRPCTRPTGWAVSGFVITAKCSGEALAIFVYHYGP